MELNKAVEILMHLHRYKLGKADKPNCTDTEINTARNVLVQYNNVQRVRLLQHHPQPSVPNERGN